MYLFMAAMVAHSFAEFEQVSHAVATSTVLCVSIAISMWTHLSLGRTYLATEGTGGTDD